MPESSRPLLEQLVDEYGQVFSASADSHARALRVLVDGISHGARTFAPYPFRVKAAQGAYVTDQDGHRLLDYWQGHYGNILGHNPPEITEPLISSLRKDYGLQTGLPEEAQTDLAEMLVRLTGHDQVRLTTSGTLATMYALMIARAYTNRNLVLKVGGGWHGANPLALKGVAHSDNGYDHVDSAGMSSCTEEEILVIRFNDTEALESAFVDHGDRIAAFIFEPCPSIAGFIPATLEFMQAARRLTEEYGAMLVLDEVITGFRYCASGAQSLYGVQADLSTFGKIMGGGMPVAAVAGQRDLMATVSEAAEPRVWFNGGTYSAHPLSVLAALTMLRHLETHQHEIYPELSRMGERLRRGIEQVMQSRDILARCTGYGNGVVPESSLTAVYFPRQDDLHPTAPDELNDPELCDVTMTERVLKLGLLLRGVNVMHGLGALSTAHSEKDVQQTLAAFDDIAARIKASR